jgi:2-methylisocitrate lyase-like PEP mutase family enzyme
MAVGRRGTNRLRRSTMEQREKYASFARLHVKGAPVLLYNAWDAGSAKAIQAAGGKAIATSSWSVAAAQGYSDGENLPLADAYRILGRIAAAVTIPVTADFEGGYSDTEEGLRENVAQLLQLGIVGLNFEDRIVRGEGLYPVDRQAHRIATIRETAERAGVSLFINARTDLFLGRGTPDPADSVAEALARAVSYAEAGASGFFVPGLTDEGLIRRICEAVRIPVNLMMMQGAPSVNRVGELGVARVSWGNASFVEAMNEVERAARRVLR